MPSWRLLVALLLLLPCAGRAAVLRLCSDVHPHAPFLMPDASGSADRVVTQAAREAGFTLVRVPVPLTRCKAEVEVRLIDGFPMTPYLPDLLPFIAFPMHDGAVDQSRATVRARVMLYRRAGSAVEWDGRKVSGLQRAVLVPAGSIGMVTTLEAMGVRVDDMAKSLEINFAKLLAGRGDAAAGFEEDGARLLAQPEFAGKIEAVPVPLYRQIFYLGVATSYYEQHGAAVEKMWDAIGRLNQPAKPLKK